MTVTTVMMGSNAVAKATGELDSQLNWEVWCEDENGNLGKQTRTRTVTLALEELRNQLPKICSQVFVKEKQAESYQQDKEQAQPSESTTCSLQMDFSENFTCTFQDEIQSAH